MVSRIYDDWIILSEVSLERSELKTAGVWDLFLCLYAPRANLSAFPTHFRISFGALS